jgi:hypothetical protein
MSRNSAISIGKTGRMLACCALAATLAAVFAGVSQSATPGAVLDQSNHVIEGSATLMPGFEVAQTFTAQRTGVLSDVVLSLGAVGATSDPLLVSIIRVTAAGEPDEASVLATAAVTDADVPTGTTAPVNVAFSAGAIVTAGSMYAVWIRTESATGYTIEGSGSADFYAGGKVFLKMSPAPWDDAGGNSDAYFETWVLGLAPYVPPPPTRLGYCLGGLFLDLVYGQPAVDQRYATATPALFIEGRGITCDPPPAGYVASGFAGDEQHVPGGAYPFYARPPS